MSLGLQATILSYLAEAYSLVAGWARVGLSSEVRSRRPHVTGTCNCFVVTMLVVKCATAIR